MGRGLGLVPLVCLHFRDYKNVEILAAVSTEDVEPVWCGNFGDSMFLDRFERITSGASLVTSNVVSTAIFYAAFLGTPVTVSGPMTPTVLGDRDDNLVGNREWISDNYPELLSVCENPVDLGKRELGFEHVKSKEELFGLLYGKDEV